MTSSENCLVDFDFCRRCYGLEPSEHNVLEHDFSHSVVVRSMWLHPFRAVWIKFRGQAIKTYLIDKIKANTLNTSPPENSVPTVGSGAGPSSSSNLNTIGTCARCAAKILDQKTQFYVCGEYSCVKDSQCSIYTFSRKYSC